MKDCKMSCGYPEDSLVCANYAFDSFKDWLNLKFLYHTLWQIQVKDLSENNEIREELDTKLTQMMEWGQDIFEASFVYKAFCAGYSEGTIYLYPYDKCYDDCESVEHISIAKYASPHPVHYVSTPLKRGMEWNGRPPLTPKNPPAPLYKGGNNHRDIIAFQVVTLGDKPVQKAHDLKEKGEYQDYFYWHGFCAAMTEALAARVHSMVGLFLGVENAHEQSIEKDLRMEFVGKRLSFGYEALPNILEQGKILKLLNADEIGLTMTESGMLEPEYSTCAMVLTKNI